MNIVSTSQFTIVDLNDSVFTPNLLPWSEDWVVGSGNLERWTAHGDAAENVRSIFVDPFGYKNVLWRCIPDADGGASGGFTIGGIRLKRDKTYRFTCFIKRSSTMGGTLTIGMGNVNSLAGIALSNAPVISFMSNVEPDTWYLLVGILHPAGTTSAIGKTGIYNMRGSKLIEGTEYAFGVTAEPTFYVKLDGATTAASEVQLFMPTLECLDGTEESIQTLIRYDGSENDYLRDVLEKGKTAIEGGLLTSNVILAAGLDGVVRSGMSGISEDNIGFFTGGTYDDAVNNKASNIIHKDGSVRLGAGAFAYDKASNRFNLGNFILLNNDIIGVDNGVERVRFSGGDVPSIGAIDQGWGYYAAGVYGNHPDSGAIPIELSPPSRKWVHANGAGYADSIMAFSISDEVFFTGSKQYRLDDVSIDAWIYNESADESTITATWGLYNVLTDVIVYPVGGPVSVSTPIPVTNSGRYKLKINVSPRIKISGVTPYQRCYFEAYFRCAGISQQGVHSRSLIGRDGIMSYYSANSYFYYKEAYGFEARFGGMGFRVSTSGIQKMVDGSTWVNDTLMNTSLASTTALGIMKVGAGLSAVEGLVSIATNGVTNAMLAGGITGSKLTTGYGDTTNPYGSKTAKHFLAAPNASTGVPSFRAIVASDIPTLNQNTTGQAGSLARAEGTSNSYRPVWFGQDPNHDKLSYDSTFVYNPALKTLQVGSTTVGRIMIGGGMLVWDNDNNALKVVSRDGTTTISLYATGSSAALGIGSGGGGSSYDRLDSWTGYDVDQAGWVLSAGLGHDTYTRVLALEASTPNIAWGVMGSGYTPLSVNGITRQLSTNGHTHTKAGITDFAHTHLWADITDKPTTFTPSSHTHTKSQITDFPTTWAWGSLSGVPSTFAPSAHTHTISDVTGLQTALNSKLETSIFNTHNNDNVRHITGAERTKWDGVVTDFAGLEIGGRNLIIRSSEEVGTWVSLSGNIVTSANHSTTDYIKVEPSSTYSLSKIPSVLVTEGIGGYWRYAWYDEDKVYISRKAETSLHNLQWTIPSNAHYVRLSYPIDSQPKFEKGNKATDWTPAPEDVDASIATVQTNLNTHAALTNNPHSVTATQVGLGNVENTALSAWAGSGNITALGTVVSGTWNATTISVGKGGTGKTSVAANSMLYATAANTYGEVATTAFGRGLLSAVSGTVVTGLYAANAEHLYGVRSGLAAWTHTQRGGAYQLNIYCTAGQSAEGAPSDYAVGLSVESYYGFSIAAYGGSDSDRFWIRNNNNTWRILTHSGNSNLSTVDWSAKNLTLAGSITGATTISASGTITAGGARVKATLNLKGAGLYLESAGDKYTRILGEHFITSEKGVSLLTSASTDTSNVLYIGGGTSSGRAMTIIQFMTAANTTTDSGTERMIIGSDGFVGIGFSSNPSSYKLAVNGSGYYNGNLSLSSADGSYLQIGAGRLVWDATNNAIKVIKSDGTAANFYATGSNTALGVGTGGGGSSYNMVSDWSQYVAGSEQWVVSAQLINAIRTSVTGHIGDSTHASAGEKSNWNAAYSHSLVSGGVHMTTTDRNQLTTAYNHSQAAHDYAPSAHVGATGAAHGVASTSVAGFMSSTDKSKLDGIATSANNYTHPTSGVTAGTYKSVTVNTAGHVTGGTNPTTLSGYGITDAMPTSHAANGITLTDRTNWGTAYSFANGFATNYPDLVAIEAIAGTSGLLKKTAANTWSLDTNTYLTGITKAMVEAALTGAITTHTHTYQAPLTGTGFVKSTAGVISYDDSVYAISTHTHTYASTVKLGTVVYDAASNIISLPAYPTTLPASDVSSWAKAANKPSYTTTEVSEGTNYYYTAARVLATTIGAVTPSNTALASGITVSTALDRIQGQINARALLAGVLTQDFATKNLAVAGTSITTGMSAMGLATPYAYAHVKGGIITENPNYGVGNAGGTTTQNRAGIVISSNHATNNSVFWLSTDATVGNALNIGIGNTFNDTNKRLSLSHNGLLTASNFATANADGAYMQVGPIKILYDATYGAIRVEGNIYATGSNTAFGIGGGAGGGGLITNVYGTSGFGGSYSDVDLSSTFNAYAINSLYTALQGKQNTITGAISTLVSSNLYANYALVSGATGKIQASGVTATELFYLSGVSSNIQSQLNAKPSVNSYPTAFSWNAGSTSGPTATISGSNMTAISVAAIPAASGTASGIVTTGAQSFSGEKSFNSSVWLAGTNALVLDGASQSIYSHEQGGPVVTYNNDTAVTTHHWKNIFEGLLEVKTGNALTSDIAAQPAGTIQFANGATANEVPVIIGKSSSASTGTGLTLSAATANTNAIGDMTFGVRQNNNTDYTDFTKDAFKWSRYATNLMTLRRNGLLTLLPAINSISGASQQVNTHEFSLNSTNTPTYSTRRTSPGVGMILMSMVVNNNQEGADMMFNVREQANADFYAAYRTQSAFSWSRYGTTLMNLLRNGNLSVLGSITAMSLNVSAMQSAPSSASAAGTTGEIRFTSTGLFICIATNTWRKATISTF